MTRRSRYSDYEIAGRLVSSCGPGCYSYNGCTIERLPHLDAWMVRGLKLTARSLGELFDLIDKANR